MKALILWTQWSGYMDACAKELQALLGCDLDIVCLPSMDANPPYREERMFEFPCRPYVGVPETLAHIGAQPYGLVLVCGWHIKAFRDIARRLRGRAVRLLCMDNQWIGSPRQYVGMLAFRAHWRELYDFAFVPGVRQARFASQLGFAADEIIEGHLSCADAFADLAHARRPKSFLYVGRLVSVKGICELASAWRLYLDRNRDPWTLKLCGAGPLQSLFDDIPHTQTLGFVQPGELPAVMARASALVLPSRREPWGVVVHEAAKAGLGLVLTSACGAADYFLRDGVNGRITSPGDPTALCEALQWFHALDDGRLADVREMSALLGAQRSPLSWACDVARALELSRRRGARSRSSASRKRPSR